MKCMIQRMRVCKPTLVKAVSVARRRGTYGDDERVGEPSNGVSELVGELDVVVVKPASGDVGEAVEARNAPLSEEARQQVTNDTTDTVSGEDLQRYEILNPLSIRGTNVHRGHRRIRGQT